MKLSFIVPLFVIFAGLANDVLGQGASGGGSLDEALKLVRADEAHRVEVIERISP